jgi:hypothetical protein
MRHTLKQKIVVGALGCFLAFAPRAHATVAVQVDRAQLSEMSDLIVRATVVSVTHRWNEDHSQILTLTQLRVTEYIKGDGGVELVLRQFGGQVDGLVSRISGEAYLEPGQDVVLSLRRGEGVVYLTAMSQSVWYVAPQSGGALVVHRDMSGLTLARVVNGQMRVIEQPTADATETLVHLVSDIRTMVRRGRPTEVLQVTRVSR